MSIRSKNELHTAVAPSLSHVSTADIKSDGHVTLTPRHESINHCCRRDHSWRVLSRTPLRPQHPLKLVAVDTTAIKHPTERCGPIVQYYGGRWPTDGAENGTGRNADRHHYLRTSYLLPHILATAEIPHVCSNGQSPQPGDTGRRPRGDMTGHDRSVSEKRLLRAT